MNSIVVVNDTNIFIDLFNVGLLEEFFSLPWEIHTTDLVMLELVREGQQTLVSRYKETGRLLIPTLEGEDVLEIGRMFQEYKMQKNLSYTDCSVWYYAKKNSYVLLTGDRKLRTASVLDGVEVHGTIYVLDNLVACGLLSHADAIDKLNLLYDTNPRLPQEEKAKRINLWKFEMSKKGDCL